MLAKFSVKKFYTVLVGVVLVVVLGIVSLTKMTTDLLPNISLPYVIVMTTYVGASPETVEMVVTKPVESAMATVSNIENINSVSSENYSMVVMEFAQSTNMDSISLEIREKLDQIKSYWDDSIGSPIIMKLNPDMMPIMVAALGKEGLTNAQISDFAKNDLIPELESIEGVASASGTGLIEESVNVIIRQDKIDAINKQVFGYIDSEMADKEEELADGKNEIADKKGDLADAQKELNDSKKEIEDGKADIEKGKKDLTDGQSELNSKKEESIGQLASMETQLLTAKADLEAAKMNISSQTMMVQKLADGLKEAEAKTAEPLAQIEEGINQLTLGITEIDNGIAQINDGITQIENSVIGIKSLIDVIGKATNMNPSADVAYLLDAIDKNMWLPTDQSESIKALLNAYPNDTPLTSVSDNFQFQLTGLEDQRAQLNEQKTPLDEKKAQLNVQKIELENNKKQIQDTINQLKDSLASATAGMGAEAYLKTLNDSLPAINGNIEKVNNGLNELYKGNLTAATELANAQAKIDLGKFSLDMAETQMEAGEMQLESGQDQIDSGFEQLNDALDQLKDGEEQLADAKEDAYDKANMNDILTVDTIKSLLTAQNFSMPGGYVTEDGIEYLVRVGDKPQSVEELSAMPIMNPDMDGVDVITLADVADVFMTDNSADIYTNVNGSPGVLVTIQKQTGYSTGDVADKLKDKFASMRENDPDLTTIILMDQGIYIDMVMDSIVNNVLFGALLAVFILIIFLKDLRPTFIIACSIPISLISAIVCMYFSGVTLNIISLSGLALGVGMLVDNSIVVIENIYRMRSEGRSMREASIEGAKEVSNAIMASTLTTVCVFLPIVFTEGITRQLFVDMGLTIAYSLGASLLIALTVVPAMASKMLTHTKDQKDDRVFRAIIKGYEKVLRGALKVKPLVLIVIVVLLVISAIAAFSRGTAFIPDMESTQATITVELPTGTPLSETAEVTDEILKRLHTIDDVVDTGAMSSTSNMSILTGGGNSATNSTQIYVTVKEDKELTGEQLAEKIKELTADIEDVELTINTSSMDMSMLGGSGISIQVRGREIDTLRDIATDISKIVEATEGTFEVSDGMEEDKEDLRIIIDRDKAIEHGLTVAQIFQQIAAKLAASTSATTFETEIKDYDVYVKNANDSQLTRDTIKNINIDVTKNDGTKEKIPLKEMASFETKKSPASINRADQNRYIEVSAAIADGYNVGLVSQELQKELDKYEMPEGYTLKLSGENEMITDAMEQVSLMLILAILFMYLIMVAQFQSLMSPFIIMFTIPLAFTGGFLGLYISGSEVSIIALIGFVMLSGVIVNNGIVLVDYVNQLRSEGMEKREALIEAGRTRLRPVLMTALTTILALSTMVFGHDMGSEMGRPMAVVTIGGLVYGTLLTLIVVPCIYDLFIRDKKKKKEELEDLSLID